MSESMFAKKLGQLNTELIAQGQRVVDLTMHAVESYFDQDDKKADAVIRGDAEIDNADVRIERASIPMMAMGETDEHEIRYVLTIVKINNELERVADCAVSIAEQVRLSSKTKEKIPERFRVMANSVVGMLRDASQAMKKLDPSLAERILSFDDAVTKFTRELMDMALAEVAKGRASAAFAGSMLTVMKWLERIADHSTNICEQLIYLESGKIVRHSEEGWSKPALPT
ncbi:MAG TPA: phosphate signaling complex protein PhoU [Phycisphaerales bacterium]|nr:phosphate signaling complex protein PhoU [Phycisphaerales bacterium]